MMRKRGVLKEHEIGDLCRKRGIREATFYNWKSRYGRCDGEARRLLPL
jgi:putative transposase